MCRSPPVLSSARLQKVKASMRCIKVVLGERQRAEAAYAADQARLAKLNDADKDKLQAAQAILASAEGSAASTTAAAKPKGKGAAKEVRRRRRGGRYCVLRFAGDPSLRLGVWRWSWPLSAPPSDGCPGLHTFPHSFPAGHRHL